MTTNQPTSEWNDVLKRYLAIQAEEARLKEEKATLQDRIAAHMRRERRNTLYPDVDGQKLKVRFNETTVVRYDEDVLKTRLQDRYRQILAPDPRKIRAHPDELTPALEPVLDLIGTPSADRVRAAVESGAVTKAEFAGAFEKTVRRQVAVSRFTPGRGDAPPPDEEREAD
jgi:hypothetical protein